MAEEKKESCLVELFRDEGLLCPGTTFRLIHKDNCLLIEDEKTDSEGRKYWESINANPIYVTRIDENWKDRSRLMPLLLELMLDRVEVRKDNTVVRLNNVELRKENARLVEKVAAMQFEVKPIVVGDYAKVDRNLVNIKVDTPEYTPAMRIVFPELKTDIAEATIEEACQAVAHVTAFTASSSICIKRTRTGIHVARAIVCDKASFKPIRPCVEGRGATVGYALRDLIDKVRGRVLG